MKNHTQRSRRGVLTLGVVALAGCSSTQVDKSENTTAGDLESESNETKRVLEKQREKRLQELKDSDNDARGKDAIPAYCKGDCESIVDLSVKMDHAVFDAWNSRFAIQFDEPARRSIEIIVRNEGSIKGSRQRESTGRAWNETFVHGEGGDDMVDIDEATIYIDEHE